MQQGFIVSVVFSALLHVAVILVSMVTLTSIWENKEEYVVLPVEILTIDDETNVAALPEVPDEEVIEETAPEAPQFSEAEPEIEVPVPEDSIPLPPEVKKEEKKPDLKKEDVSEVMARARPRRKPKPPSPKKDDFDLDQIGEVLKNVDDKPEPQVQKAPEDELLKDVNKLLEDIDERPKQRVGFGTGLSMSEQDALRHAIYGCWRPPVGAANPEELVVELTIYLNKDGTLSKPPRVTRQGTSSFGANQFALAAAEAAKRAVLRCQPYAMLPADKYERWKEVDLVFDPSKMVGR